MRQQTGNQGGFWDFLERVLALKITAAERLRYADDSENVFADNISGRKPLQVAAILAFLFHLVLLFLYIPSFGDTALVAAREVFVIRQLARPAQLAGAEGRPRAPTPEPKPIAPKRKPVVIPIPDPTPHAPDPIKKKELDEVPKIVDQLALELNLGDVTAPPGPPSQGGRGKGPLDGEGLSNNPGPGSGTSSGGVYRAGGGVTNPVVLVKTDPKFTDEAIKAKSQGVVFLQAVVRKNGRVDSFKVLRALGYGLEESAIREIATNWRFKPGTFNGQNVDVLVTIEVNFNLR